MRYLHELVGFVRRCADASLFGALLLVGIIVIRIFPPTEMSSLDVLFLYAVVVQLFLIVFGYENKKEVAIILIFHILASVMEIFKTHPSIGSWSYPGVESTFFAVLYLPLFAGFMYSAVGSFVVRAQKTLELSYSNYPRMIVNVFLSILIYLNFFTHHFMYDLRYIIFILIALFFYKTKVHFKTNQKTRSMSFIVAGLLTAFFIWIAENIASFSKVWLYPNHVDTWHLVSLGKFGSWFLLLMFSFIIVNLFLGLSKKERE